MEIWKDITEFEGRYQVSNLGRIRTLGGKHGEGKGYYTRKEKIMSPSKAGRYAIATLCSNGKQYYKHVHRLVAEAFLPNTDNKPYINHIDGDTFNNQVNNLEWATNSENQLHSVYNLKNGMAKPVKAFNKKTYEFVVEFPSVTKAAEWLLDTGRTKDKTCLTGIIKSCKGKIPSYQGFKWQYVE